ncbi:sulfotransferase domain-containing protein [Winogradskyella sp. 3972H.M.0a.05]|uniref:sulfotransferase domain-containing protein n=1 Tax=Winogradskyella sp. 3972H.M.0a.05 TaxID=2950277 RepID=UPI003395BB3D
MIKVAIHSAPRSGSTWLGQLFNSSKNVKYCYQPLFSYALKDFLDDQSSSQQINDFYYELLKTKDDFINQTEAIEKGIIPKFEKREITHICYKEVRYHHILENLMRNSEDLKLVLLIRHPLEVLSSWYKAPREFRKDLGWNFEEEWLHAEKKNENKPESFYGYQKWKDTSNLFLNLQEQNNDRVRLITYKELLEDTTTVTNNIFSFLELEFSDQTERFISESKSTNQSDAYSVYKVKRNNKDWKALPEEVISYVANDLKGTNLERFLDE